MDVVTAAQERANHEARRHTVGIRVTAKETGSDLAPRADITDMVGIFVTRRDNSTLECELTGLIRAHDVALMRTQLEAFIATAANADAHSVVVIQTASMSGFGDDVRTPMIELLRDVHRAGVQLIVGVAASVFARMTGYAIAMSAGVPLRVAHYGDQVDEILAEELKKRATRPVTVARMTARGR